MKTLKKLAAAVVLMSVLSLSAFADDPVLPPCVPGDINTPPCAMAQVPDPEPGDMATLGTKTDETSLTEIAANVIFGIASLF
jgi:hypothetical protein